jgi:protein-S-isoprenylcysteine O-methyltransferase Ste14
LDQETLFRFIQAVVFIGFVAHRGYYNRKFPASEADTLEKQDPGMSSRIANLLAIPALIGLGAYLISPAWMAWASMTLPAWSRWGGVGLAGMGFALLQWSHAALGKNWSDHPRITAAQTLVTDGPYRRIRHPIYTSFILILGSSLYISANWFIGLLWIVATAIDIETRIRFEEEKMIARFGKEYRRYKERSGSLLPRF